jgi:hypothetical protein
MKLPRVLLTVVAAVGLPAAVNADLSYTFNADLEGTQLAQWVSPGPVGWPGGPVFTSVNTAGGWTLGGGGGPYKEFSWTAGGGVPIQQVEMQNLANLGNSRLAFDIIVDGTSFNANAQWYQIHYAGNSGGAAGWTQAQAVNSYQNAGQADLRTWHIDVPFSAVGWGPDDNNGWFQFYWGANSDAANPVHFYIDNFQLYAIPEPGIFALAGLGAAALLIFRRK